MSTENDFLLFAGSPTANVEAQTTWASDAVVSTGFQSGTANSAQVNKVLRQCSIMANTLASFIVAESGQPAIDNGTSTTLVTNLTAAINALITAFVANALGTGGTVYNPQFQSVSADNIDPSNGGQYRLTYGNYGAMLRNDGGSFYLLMTNSGSPTGTFNSLRPLTVNLSTGAVTIDGTNAGTTFGGKITSTSSVVNGNSTISGSMTSGSLTVTGGTALQGGANVSGTCLFSGAVTINSLATTAISNFTGGAITTSPASGDSSTAVPNTQWVTNSFAKLSQFSSNTSQNGYQKLPSGMIFQWGYNTISGSSTTITFPIAFPNACLGVVSNDDGAPGAGTSGVHLTSCVPLSTTQFNAYATNAATGGYATTNVFWFAIGS